MTDQLPVRVGGEHRPLGPTWMCGWCFGPWPCPTFRRMLLAYYRDNPSQLLPHMMTFLRQARAHPEFRHQAAEVVRARFVGWISHDVAAQLDVERIQRAASRITSWVRARASSFLTTRSGVKAHTGSRERGMYGSVGRAEQCQGRD